MSDALQPGMCTVIVARSGPVEPQRDQALLTDVEAAFGLRSGSLARHAGMDRPEFRLLEGVSRDAADRLAGIAVEHGYAPRVRDKLGIKWSNQRGQGSFAVGIMALSVVFALLLSGGAAVLGEAAFFAGAVGFPVLLVAAMMLWRRSIFLPLVLDRAALAPRSRAAAAEETPVEAAATEALQALDELSETIRDEAPVAARGDLLRTHGELATRVDDLRRQGSALVLEPSVAGVALQDRLDALAPDDPATGDERSSLEDALADEAAAMRDARARHTAVLTELMGVRRTVRAAVADLRADDPERDPTAGLQAQVAALRDATDEARVRAQRARQAQAAKPQGS